MKKILIVLFFLISIIIYALVLRGVSGNVVGESIRGTLDTATKPFELSPERGRFLLTYSLAENKSFALSEKLAEAADPDVGYYKGKYYVYFGPGISILALPFYYIGKNYGLNQVGSYSVIALFAWLNGIVLYYISRKVLRFKVWTSLLSSLIFAFGSVSLSYSNTMYQHHVSTFLILSSFLASWYYNRKYRFGWLGAVYIWFAFGAGLFIDYPNAILMLPVMVYFFISSFSLQTKIKSVQFSWRLSFIVTSIVFITLLAVHGYYNYVNFGDWKRVSGSLISAKTAKDLKKQTVSTAEEKIAKAANQKVVTGFFKEDKTPMGFSILTFAIDKGIFIFSPIFLIALLGIYKSLKKPTFELSILAATAGINLFFYSSWGDPWGGWAFGPRYLIPAMAVLSLFVSYFLNNTKWQFVSKIITFILFNPSAAIALVGALTTNQVPPKIEADFLKMKYNFLLNFDYLFNSRSSSYIYNTFVSSYYSLYQFYVVILCVVIIMAAFILFVLPVFDNNEH